MQIRTTAALLAVTATLGTVGAAVGYAVSIPGPGEPAPQRAIGPANPQGRFPHTRRVALLMLENRSYEQIVGNPKAPYLNRLARANALETRAYAVAHPSLPNYVALTGGSTSGIRNDCSSCDTEATNLVDQMGRAGISWRGYFQSIPATGSTTIRAGNYSAHYNPFTYFTRTRSRDTNTDRIVSFARLHRDLASGRLPRFSWISPDLAHDGHNNSVASTDRYARQMVPRLVHALGRHGVLYVTWDEGRRSDHRGLHGGKGGKVALIAAGSMARHGVRSARPVNQYALLRSIEAGFGLKALGHAADTSTPLLTGLVSRTGN